MRTDEYFQLPQRPLFKEKNPMGNTMKGLFTSLAVGDLLLIPVQMVKPSKTVVFPSTILLYELLNIFWMVYTKKVPL